MKSHLNKTVVFLVLILFFPFLTVAADSSNDSDKSSEPAAPAYKPPMRGAPAGRVGGGTRGATERESFALQVLTPDHIGYTSKDQPCLYWFISKPTAHSIEMTVTERNAVQPLFTKLIAGPAKGGIQEFCLAEYGVHLKPEVPYKWFVVLVTDKEDRSKDILAGGMIQKMEATDSLKNRLMSKGKVPNYFIYAEEGYWFDSLESITKEIKGSHGSKDGVRQRAALLRQVGLTDAADAETEKQ